MNLLKILDEYYIKMLKVYGIHIHSRMNEEEMEEFNKELWSSGMKLKDINKILEIIDDYMKENGLMG